MYETHFGLRHRPFRTSPDRACYYPATSHEAALTRLLQALADGEGVMLLTGQPGTGKTLLCHCLLERLGSGTASLFLPSGAAGSRAALLQAILYDLSLPYEGRGEQEMRLAVTDSLLRSFGAGKRTVLVIDEAQNLSPDLLEELRLLGNLEARQGKALQVVLATQPGFLETLHRPELAAFSQRIAVRVHLEPLPFQEAADYLLHQVRACGGRPEEILSEEALELLSRASRGVPRLLNQAAHQAMVLAHGAGARQVDVEAALEALVLLGLETEQEPATDADAPLPAPKETTSPEDDEQDTVLSLDKLEASGPPSPGPKPERTGRLFATPRRPAG